MFSTENARIIRSREIFFGHKHNEKWNFVSGLVRCRDERVEKMINTIGFFSATVKLWDIAKKFGG